MSGKQKMCVVGAVVGVVIIIIGFCVMNPETYTVGDPFIKFGADFYTEIYDVTRAVGGAMQRNYTNICNAIGWLIVALGAMDVCYFLLKAFDSAQSDTSAPNNVTHQQQKCAPTQSLVQESISTPMVDSNARIKNDEEYIPYRCGKCGQNGPYDEKCPNCGSSIKFYNMPQTKVAQPVLRTAEKHSWRCHNCGEMATQSPCEHCGK